MADVMKLGLILSATDKISRVLDGISNKFSKLDKVGKGFQKTGAYMFGSGAAVAGVLAANFTAVADRAKELRLETQKIGMNMEAFEKFSGYAKKTGIATDSFTASIAKMEKAQVSAASGGVKQALAFKMIGISIFGADGKLKKSENLLSELSDKFSKAPDGAIKTAAAMAIFGKTGKDMIPMLNKGSKGLNAYGDELERTGNILSIDQIEAFRKYTEQLGHAKTSVSGLKTQIAVALLPRAIELADKITEITTKVTDWVDKNKELFTSIVEWTGKIAGGLLILGGFNMAFGTVIRTVGGFIDAYKLMQRVLKSTAVLDAIKYLKDFNMVQKLTAAWTWATSSATWAWAAALWATGIPEIVLGVVALGAGLYFLIKYWDDVTASMKKFGSYILSAVLDPVILVLKAIGELTGAKWAFDMAAKMEKFKSKLDVTASTPIQSRSVAAAASVSNSRNNSNSSQVTYSPTIHINGSVMDKAGISSVLNDHTKNFEQMMTEIQNKNRRLAYSGS